MCQHGLKERRVRRGREWAERDDPRLQDPKPRLTAEPRASRPCRRPLPRRRSLDDLLAGGGVALAWVRLEHRTHVLTVEEAPKDIVRPPSALRQRAELRRLDPSLFGDVIEPAPSLNDVTDATSSAFGDRPIVPVG